LSKEGGIFSKLLDLPQYGLRPQITNEDVVLLIFYLLKKENVNRIREYEIHQISFKMREFFEPSLLFSTAPINYSGKLKDILRNFGKKNIVAEYFFIHNGWSPKYVYELTLLGQSEGSLIEQKMRTYEPDKYKGIIRATESFLASTSLRELH